MQTNKIASLLLSASIIICSLPISSTVLTTNAIGPSDIPVPPQLYKTDDAEYSPTFNFATSSWKTSYDNIVARSSDIHEIYKLPNFEEFKTLTGYVSPEYMTLTKFMQTYGTGDNFVEPSEVLTIYIENEGELDQLSNFVNHKDNVTNAEQAYYSTANYKLGCQIDYTGVEYQPIGTETYPFSGTFDGDGYEIDSVKLIDDVETKAKYSGYDYLGVFGYISSTAVIRNVGITNMTLTANYVLGGDAAFLCARNNGTIENCYVNGKDTSVLTISNSTAGGICGENYGTIRDCYADATINVFASTGAYSEPQPIATVNHTSDGAVVTNCYYIKKSLVSAATTSTKSLIYSGWEYSGDTSLINGTPLAVVEFTEHLSDYISSFNDSKFNYTTRKSSSTIAYNRLMSLDELRGIVGTGSHFTAEKRNYRVATGIANTYFSDNSSIVELRSRDDWNTFCKLVNKAMPGETDAEQAFWSNVGIVFAGEVRTVNNKNVEVFDMYADDETLGSVTYPYNGVMYTSRNVIVNLHFDNRGDGVAKPIFGVTTNNITMNFMFDGDNIGDYIDKNIVCDKIDGGTVVFKLYDNSYFQTHTESTDCARVYYTDPNYATLADMNYSGISLIGNLNGGQLSVRNGACYQWYDSNGDIAGYNYINTLRTKADGATLKNCYIFLQTGETSTITFTNAKPNSNSSYYNFHYSDITAVVKWNRDYSSYSTSTDAMVLYVPTLVYPTLVTPYFDGTEYKLYNLKEFLWLLKYGNGENVRLMNTIDLSNYVFKKTYKGYFNLDGTLTNHGDICDQIDINVTKCYGLLNIHIDDTNLSGNSDYFDGLSATYLNKINWSNVYFIGGEIIYGTKMAQRTQYSSYILGTNLDNVHVSADIVLNNKTASGYYNTSSQSITHLSLANNAVNSSTASKVIINSNTTYPFAALAYDCTDCVTYANLQFNVVSHGNCGLAIQATHCLVRSTVSLGVDINTFKTAGLNGNSLLAYRYAYNCLADWTYDLSASLPYPLFTAFGDNTNNYCKCEGCTFSGIYNSHTTKILNNYYTYFSKGLNDFVATPESQINGIMSLNGSNSVSNNIILTGTVNAYAVDSEDFIEYCTSTYFGGTFNVYRDTDETKYTDISSSTSTIESRPELTTKCNSQISLKLTSFCSNTIFDSDFNIVDFDNCFYTDLSITISDYTKGNFTNYSDFEFTGNYRINKFIIVNGNKISTPVNAINYGDITVNAGVVMLYITAIGEHMPYCKNFGDISVYDGSNSTSVCAIRGSDVSDVDTCINYGYITVQSIKDDATIREIMGVNGYRNSVNYGNIYADITATTDGNGTIICGNSYEENNATIEVTGQSKFRDVKVSGGAFANYGTILVHDFTGRDKNNLLTGTVCVSALRYYDFLKTNLNHVSKCSVEVVDVEAEEFKYIDLVTYTGSSGDNLGTENYVTANNVELHNISVKNMTVNCGYQKTAYASTNPRNLYNADVHFPSVKVNTVANILSTMNVHDCNVTAFMKIDGVAHETTVSDTACKYNNADITIKDSTINKFSYAGITRRNNAIHDEYVNNANLLIDNVTIASESYVTLGISNISAGSATSITNTEFKPGGNIFNTGTSTINVRGAKINVSGIYRGSQIGTGRANNNIVANFGDITVTNDKDIVLNGVFGNDTTHTGSSYCYNAINCGNLTGNIISGGTGTVTINGIADDCTKIAAVENFGTLSTSATKGSIHAIAGKVRTLAYGYVNYGDILNGNFGSSQAAGLIRANSSSTKLNYGINYGVFSKPLSNNLGTFSFIVDLSGKKASIPQGEWTFSTDSTYSGVTGVNNKNFNDLTAVISEYSHYEDTDLSTRYIDYSTFIAPEFAFRYNNPLAVSYLTSTTKEEYNGDNLFEYTLEYNSEGELKNRIDSFSGAGGYCLCAVNALGEHLLGMPLEAKFFVSDTMGAEHSQSWWNNFHKGSQTIKQYIDSVLTQRYNRSKTNILDVNIQSVDTYETVENNMQNVTNISSLIPFQAPVRNAEIDDGGVYNSETNIVTIIDLYVLANLYKNIQNQNIEWEVNRVSTNGDTMYLYESPILYNDATAFKNGIRAVSSSLPVSEYSDTTTLPLKAIGGTTYAIIGFLQAEDGIHRNIMAVRLHSSTTQPLGWLTKFKYQTDVTSNGTTRIYTDALKGSTSFYNATKGYEPYEEDLYTVDVGTTDTYTYPIYNMTLPMVRTTVGYTYTKTTFSTTGDITYNFNVQNVNSYRIRITNETDDYFEGTGTPPTTGASSADGTVIFKTNNCTIASTPSPKLYKNGVVNKDNQITITFNSNNPFYRSGLKKMEVWGTADNDDEIKLFEVNINKSASFENYILRHTDSDRYWFGQHNNVPEYEISEVLNADRLYNSILGSTYSQLATAGPVNIEIVNNKYRGTYTKFPEHIVQSQTITAEDGGTATYIKTITPNDFNILDFTSVNNFTDCYEKDGIVVMNDASETFRFAANENETKLYQFGIQQHGKFLVEKFDIYVDGVYQRTADTSFDVGTVTEGIRDNTWGIYVRTNSYESNIAYTRKLWVGKDNTVPKADLPELPISIKPYIYYVMPDGDRIQIECEMITFIKKLNPDRQLLSVNTRYTITSTYISEFSDAEAINVDMNGTDVVYNVDYTELPNLYITDVVEPNCPSTNVQYTISRCATLERYVGSEWVTQTPTTTGGNVFNIHYDFTMDGLGAGYNYQYRIVAQDYTTEDVEKATHITYFTHSIGSVTRNKHLYINFKTDDTDTMALYDEIIGNNGNLNIQVKNMNIDQLKYQQTKFYIGDTSLESNYYNISRGDYSILVNIPDGYEARVKIVGGSTEGYLTENPYVRGKRLRLPFANEQTIRLEVTLYRVATSAIEWGNRRYRSAYKSELRNVV